MSDAFSLAVRIQRELLTAHRTQLDLAQTMMDAGKQVAAAHAVTLKAAEANVRAWQAWGKLWGLK